MRLHVESGGSGPDLVLLHGWGMTAAVWQGTAAALAKKYRVHCVDLPGHGASAACTPYTLDAVTDALSAVFPQPVLLCGWSLGGQVALNWALRAPGQVSRMVLVATTPCFVNGAQWDYGIDITVFDGFLRDLDSACGAALQRFVALQATGDDHARTVLRRLRQTACRFGGSDQKILEAGLRILKDTDLRASLSRISQRVLIFHGERDTVVPVAAGQYLRRVLPDAALEVIAGAAHAPFIVHSRRMAQRIAEHCDES